MIIVDGQKLKFLLSGRTLTVDVHREYRKGRDYAVGKTHRKATCRAIVTEVEQTGGKTWKVTLKHAIEDKPVWLAKMGTRADYTSEPGKAMLDEPEPVPSAVVERFSAQARKGDDVRLRTMRAEMPRQARIAALEEAAALGDEQAKRQLFVIDQRIQQAERKQSRDAA